MPTKRSNGRYYVQRQIAGVGEVYRSLRTARKGVARKRESALMSLADQGQQDVIRAWLKGDVRLGAVVEAHETGNAADLLHRVRQGDAPLSEAVDAALDDKRPDVKATTLDRYETGLQHFQTYCRAEGVETVREALTDDRIQGFKSWRLEDVAEQTVNNDLGAVSILATYALGQGWIEERPTIKRYSYTPRIRYLDPAQYDAYIKALRPAFRPLMKLLLWTGMRLGEAEALTVDDLRMGDGEARAAVRDAKTDSGVRTVFVPPWAAEAVQAWIQKRELSGSDPIFPFARRTIQAEHNRACKAAELRSNGYTIHDHRHTAAVQLARSGIPLDRLQQQLGHANLDQTMKYADYHPEYGDVAEYFERAGERFGYRVVDVDPVERAAELLDVDPKALAGLLAQISNNNLDNTPSDEGSKEATVETL